MDRSALTRTHTPVDAPPLLDAEKHALFLDLDGTLVEIMDDPDCVVARDGLTRLLTDLQRELNGALAIVTGRSVARADAILGGVVEVIAGVHGQELRTSLTRPSPQLVTAPPAHFDEALTEIDALVTTNALPIRVEKKPLSVALHFRTTPELETTVRALSVQLAQRHGFQIIEGKKVIELAATSHTKGDAVAKLMRLPAFEGRIPVAVGDDLTDENAFRAVASLGGFSVLVGEARPSFARYRLDGPTEVHAWLQATLTETR